jgi:hypothetical protein
VNPFETRRKLVDLIQAVAELHPRGVNLLEDPAGLDAAALAEWVKALGNGGEVGGSRRSPSEKAKSLENLLASCVDLLEEIGGWNRVVGAVRLLKEGYPVDWRIFRDYWDLTASVGKFSRLGSETIIDRVARRNSVSVPTVYRKRDQVPERIAIITMRLNPDEDPGKS